MRSVAIEGKTREELGTKGAKQLRRQGLVPCVIYGAGQNIHFYTDVRSFKDILYTPEAMLAVVNIDGKDHKCVVRDSQYHSVTGDLEHVDLYQLTPGEPVSIKVPINLVGNSRGVRNGGRLKFILRKVTVKAEEDKLPGMIDLNIENLRIGQTYRISDLRPDGYSILEDPSLTVVGVRTSRVAVDDLDDEDEEDDESEEGSEGDGEGEGEGEEAKAESES